MDVTLIFLVGVALGGGEGNCWTPPLPETRSYRAVAVALAEGQPLDQAVRFANAAGAISVTRIGAQPSAPNREEIERFLAAR